MNRLQQFLPITLLIEILIKQFRNQHLAIMPLKHIQAIRRLTPRKLHHHRQGAVGVVPHQGVDLR